MTARMRGANRADSTVTSYATAAANARNGANQDSEDLSRLAHEKLNVRSDELEKKYKQEVQQVLQAFEQSSSQTAVGSEVPLISIAEQEDEANQVPPSDASSTLSDRVQAGDSGDTTASTFELIEDLEVTQNGNGHHSEELPPLSAAPTAVDDLDANSPLPLSEQARNSINSLACPALDQYLEPVKDFLTSLEDKAKDSEELIESLLAQLHQKFDAEKHFESRQAAALASNKYLRDELDELQKQNAQLHTASAFTSTRGGTVDVPKQLGLILRKLDDIIEIITDKVCKVEQQQGMGRATGQGDPDSGLKPLFMAAKSVNAPVLNYLLVALHSLILQHIVAQVWNPFHPITTSCLYKLSMYRITGMHMGRFYKSLQRTESHAMCVNWRSLTSKATWDAFLLEAKCQPGDVKSACDLLAADSAEYLIGKILEPFLDRLGSLLDDKMERKQWDAAFDSLKPLLNDVLLLKHEASVKDLKYEYELRLPSSNLQAIGDNSQIAVRTPAFVRFEADSVTRKVQEKPVLAHQAVFFMAGEAGWMANNKKAVVGIAVSGDGRAGRNSGNRGQNGSNGRRNN